jgi:hypothetical protein
LSCYISDSMKTLRAVLLITVFACGTALHAQTVPTGAHPAAADAHPAASETHPAKADAHPAAPVEIHPANPGYTPESNSTSTLGDVSTPQPFTTTSINATTPAATVTNAPETFNVPKFVDTQTNSVVVPATTSNATATNQAATTSP